MVTALRSSLTIQCRSSSSVVPVCPVLCLVMRVFDELALVGFLIIQALTERHDPSFSIVILVVVGSSPISHPIHFLYGPKTWVTGRT